MDTNKKGNGMYYLKATKGTGTKTDPMKTSYLTEKGTWTRNSDEDIRGWKTLKAAEKNLHKHGYHVTFGRFDTMTIGRTR